MYSSYDPDTDTTSYYYVNLKNGECTWTKPVVVGRSELPAPMNRWYAMAYMQVRLGPAGSSTARHRCPLTSRHTNPMACMQVRRVEAPVQPSHSPYIVPIEILSRLYAAPMQPLFRPARALTRPYLTNRQRVRRTARGSSSTSTRTRASTRTSPWTDPCA